jgi:oxalate---CoA ligase
MTIVGTMETSGRERRHRYFTSTAYKALLSKEKLDSSKGTDVDFSSIGNFSSVDRAAFYGGLKELLQFQDSFKGPPEGNTKARKKPLKNPLLPDGSVKKGRPRKDESSPKPAVSSLKRKRNPVEAACDNDDEVTTRNKRGQKKRRLKNNSRLSSLLFTLRYFFNL